MRENGAIVKCFDEMYDNFLVSDELRKVNLNLDTTGSVIISEVSLFQRVARTARINGSHS